MDDAELAVRPCIAEIKSKLLSGDVNVKRVRLGRRHINSRPHLRPYKRKNQDFDPHQDNGQTDEGAGAPRKISDRSSILVVAKFPSKVAENQLRGKEKETDGGHGLIHLAVNPGPDG